MEAAGVHVKGVLAEVSAKNLGRWMVLRDRIGVGPILDHGDLPLRQFHG